MEQLYKTPIHARRYICGRLIWLPYDCMRSINRPYNTTIISWKTFCPYYTLILNNGTILKKSVTRRVL